MGFQFSERHIEEYQALGYTVFRAILPTSLIDELRRVCDQGREMARAAHGPQTQRFQPVSAYAINQKPFQDYRDLPPLRDAVSRVLSPDYTHGKPDVLGVLLEPAEEPYCTAWHRDFRDNVPGLDVADWEGVQQQQELFNQVNCALYEDTSTWVVPGSHARPDTPDEIARFPSRPIPGPGLSGQGAAEREWLCLDYCRSMPGAECLRLDAGDFALYRNTLWHLGNYVPYKKRATLHDAPDTAQYVTWRTAALAEAERRRTQGRDWEWQPKAA